MTKRHQNALDIQTGACNPSGIAISIVEACNEIRESPGYSGTSSLTTDPALRLMVHQLAFICMAYNLDASLTEYSDVVNFCRKQVEKEKA